MEPEAINNSRRQLLRGRFSPLTSTSPAKTDTSAPRVAGISNACLSQQGIVCFTCKDICPTEAISIKPALRQSASPVVNTALCTGCSDCVASCPSQAIRLQPHTKDDCKGEQP